MSILSIFSIALLIFSLDTAKLNLTLYFAYFPKAVPGIMGKIGLSNIDYDIVYNDNLKTTTILYLEIQKKILLVNYIQHLLNCLILRQ